MRLHSAVSWPSTLVSVVCAALVASDDPVRAQYDPPPAAGPYYFVSDRLPGPGQFYWRQVQGFAGVSTIPNYNLLATVLEDTPTFQSGQEAVPTEPYNFGPGASNDCSIRANCVTLQPFAFVRPGDPKKSNLPLGTRLRGFLNDPLSGPRFDLTLPFTDLAVALSNRSAVIRDGTTESVWHPAVDFDVSGNTSQAFDVVAAADGFVEGIFNGSTQSTITLRHTASNGEQFLTIYQHLDPTTTSGLAVNSAVVRGQRMARTVPIDDYNHLHFALAVRGPSRRIRGIEVPRLWYLLDPFGVYDYRRNFTSSTAYNYVPNNTLLPPVQGVIHAYAWRTNPPIGSLLLPEDCVAFNSDRLVVQSSGSGFNIVDGSRILFSFPNQQEANTALNIVRHYRANESCFIGQPDPSFHYLLVNNSGPAGPATGEDCVSFNPATINIEALSDGRFRMVSGSQAMFVFPNMLEAGNALSAIRKYGFTRTCFVGRPDASLQYMRRESGTTGVFDLFPVEAGTDVHDRLDYAFTWTVPTPLDWHDLRSLELRIRDGERTLLSILFDEDTETFSVFDETAGRYGRAFPAGSPNRLESAYAVLDLRDTNVVGSSATGPSVTLNLALAAKPRAAGGVYTIEVAGSDDFGNVDEFAPAGTLTVRPRNEEDGGSDGEVDPEPE